MKEFVLEAQRKERTGKGINRRLRKEGFIPGVVYGKGEDAFSFKVDKKTFEHLTHAAHGDNVLIDLKLDNGKQSNVIIKELQRDPVSGDIIHIDLQKVSLKEKITVNVRVETYGESTGVKNNGGILENLTREVHIECIPGKIPPAIRLDISKLDIGDKIIVGDLKFDEEITVLSSPEQVIVHIGAPTVLKEEEKVAAATETAEPEVIGKHKKEEDEEESDG